MVRSCQDWSCNVIRYLVFTCQSRHQYLASRWLPPAGYAAAISEPASSGGLSLVRRNGLILINPPRA